MRKIIIHILFSLGWLITGGIFAGATIWIMLLWNFLSWHPTIDLESIITIAIIFAALATIWLLAKKTARLPEIITALLVCIALIYYDVLNIHYFITEKIDGNSFRSILSPYWFKILITAIPLVPTILWVCYPLQNWRKKSLEKKNSAPQP